MFTHETLKAILSDDNVFDKYIYHIIRLKEAVEAYPDATEALAQRFFAKSRINFLIAADGLDLLIEVLPKHKNSIVKLLTKALSHPKSFTNFTDNINIHALLHFQKVLPDDAENLIKLILENYFYFESINTNSRSFFTTFIKEFPRLKAFLINLIVKDPIASHLDNLNLPSRFDILFKSSFDVEDIFSNRSLTQEEKSKLAQIVLNSNIEFDRIFAGDFYRLELLLGSIIEKSMEVSSKEPTSVEINKIYTKIINDKLEYSLIDQSGKLVKENIPLEYSRIDDTGKLIVEKIQFGGQQPDEYLLIAIYQDTSKKGYLQSFSLANKFLNLLLSYPSSFEKLIKTDEKFQNLKTYIQQLKVYNFIPPNLNYDFILNKPNRLEALKLIKKNYADIRRAARVIWQGKSEDQKSEVNKLPPEILASIICFTRNPAISKNDAYNIALKYLTRPILFIDNIDDLEHFTKKFPQYMEEFANEILTNVATYKRVISNDDDLQRLVNLFPSRAEIFKYAYSYERFADTIMFYEDQARKDYLEIRKNARVLGQAQSTRDPTHSSPFAKLPKEILTKIVSLSRPEKQITNEKAEKLANDFLKKPNG